MRLVAWFYRWIGHRFAALLVHPIILYFFLTDRAGRRASRAYLAQLYSTPEGARRLGREPRMRDSYRHYLEFGQSVLDRVGIWLGRGDTFTVEIDGAEHLAHLIHGGRGGLILGGHVGSFDAMRLLAKKASPRTVKILMYTAHAARIGELFRQLGELSGNPSELGVIEARPGSFAHVLEVRKCVERGEVVAILADRVHPHERGGSAEVTFLGRTASIPESPVRFAAALGCPVVLMAGLRVAPRRYRIVVEPLAERIRIPRGPSDELTRTCQRYADWLGRMCARAPLQWFNFYDFWAEPAGRGSGSLRASVNPSRTVSNTVSTLGSRPMC
jgi:predicted LPLAT superfamily acyltransferase